MQHRRNPLIPQSWEVAWTARRNAVLLNQAAPTPPSTAGRVRLANKVPLSPPILSAQAQLTQDLNRRILILQNNSTAVAPDIAPTFYFGFGQQAVVGIDFGLAPGAGFEFDDNTPVDAVYVTVGPFTNTGNSVVIQGVILAGTSLE